MLFAKAITEGRPIKVFNHGKHQRDFTYIDDIVGGVVGSLDRAASPDPAWSGLDPSPATSRAPWRLYNIGNNRPVELLYFIECLENALGKTTEKELLPMQPGDVENTYADISRLEADIGYRPDTPIEAGVGRFVAWFTDYYGVR
jgi:UDP-glucuronate 4-epimerase